MGKGQWFQRRLQGLIGKAEAEAELDDELRLHQEGEIRNNINSGMSPTEAHKAALSGFGGSDRLKEEVRNLPGARFLDDLLGVASLAAFLPARQASLIDPGEALRVD